MPGIKYRQPTPQKGELTVFWLLTAFFFVIFAPVPHGVEDRLKAFSKLRQGVFNSRRHFRIYLSAYKTALLHIAKLRRQNLLRYAADGFFQLSEALCPRH